MGREPKPRKRKISRLLSHQEWAEVQARYEAGEPGVDIAKDFGISPSTISRKATSQGWQRGTTLKDEAIEEARKEVKESLKATYKDLVEKANERHIKMANYGQQFGAVIVKELQTNLKALQKKREELGGTDENPVYVDGFGKLAYQFNTVWGTMESAARFERDVLKLSDRDPWVDEAENQDAMQRLAEIFDEGRRRLAKGDGDVDEAATDTGEAVHPDNPPE